jgi:hypothetical protein
MNIPRQLSLTGTYFTHNTLKTHGCLVTKEKLNRSYKRVCRFIGFKVLTVVNIKSDVLWVVKPCKGELGATGYIKFNCS